jgi:hypothetical protein
MSRRGKLRDRSREDRRLFLRPWGHNADHARIGNQLPHVFVVVNDDAEIHAVDGRIPVRGYWEWERISQWLRRKE